MRASETNSNPWDNYVHRTHTRACLFLVCFWLCAVLNQLEAKAHSHWRRVNNGKNINFVFSLFSIRFSLSSISQKPFAQRYMVIVWPFPKFIGMFWWWIMLFNHLTLRCRRWAATGYYGCCTGFFPALRKMPSETGTICLLVDFTVFFSRLVRSYFSHIVVGRLTRVVTRLDSVAWQHAAMAFNFPNCPVAIRFPYCRHARWKFNFSSLYQSTRCDIIVVGRIRPYDEHDDDDDEIDSDKS